MKCPYCGEHIKTSAIKCRFCGEWLNKKKFKLNKNSLLYAFLITLGTFIILLIVREIFGDFDFKSIFKKVDVSPTPIVEIELDENKLWNLINDWEKSKGYQTYTKDDNLCTAATYYLNNMSELSLNDWYTKTNLNKDYYNYGANSTLYYNSEENVIEHWTNNKDTLKNLKDTYFQYSCIKCQKTSCVQVFANKGNPNSVNTTSSNSSDPIVDCTSGSCPIIKLKKSECNHYTCCQIVSGGSWVWAQSLEECKKIQQGGSTRSNVSSGCQKVQYTSTQGIVDGTYYCCVDNVNEISRLEQLIKVKESSADICYQSHMNEITSCMGNCTTGDNTCYHNCAEPFLQQCGSNDVGNMRKDLMNKISQYCP